MNIKAIIEGLLFVSGENGLSLDEIVEIIEIDKNEVANYIKTLYNDYSSNERGIHLEFLGNKYKLTTKMEHTIFYKKIVNQEENSALSQSSLETLAIIAYNGPITRIEVDEIRGVNSSYIIRKLLLKGLIEEVGKSDSAGKPIIYNITSKFLDYFGLGTANELPKIDVNYGTEDTESDLFNSKYSE